MWAKFVPTLPPKSDDNVFTRLYGLAWQRAESYRTQPEVVSAVNLYASAIADPLYTPQDLKNLNENPKKLDWAVCVFLR